MNDRVNRAHPPRPRGLLTPDDPVEALREDLPEFPSGPYDSGYIQNPRGELDPVDTQDPLFAISPRTESQVARDNSMAIGVSGGSAGIVTRRAADTLRGLQNTEGFRGVRPVPQRQLDPNSPAYQPGLGDYVPGGRYLEYPGAADITEQTRAGGRISAVPHAGRALGKMQVSPAAAPAPQSIREQRQMGNPVRTNMFRRSAGWQWAGEAPQGWEDTPALVSVVTRDGGRDRHFYTLNTDFENAVSMARYADSPNEPRLRPTAFGDVELGNQVGTIRVRGVEHPVYDNIYVFNRQANKMAEGGLMSPDDQYFAQQEDGDMVEVPPGATADGVRDNVDIKISEGELVVPEDVARWHGLKWFMEARHEAKEGLAAMAAEGLIKRPEGTVAASEMTEHEGLMSPSEEYYSEQGGEDDEDEFYDGGVADSFEENNGLESFDSTGFSPESNPEMGGNAFAQSQDAAIANAAAMNDPYSMSGFLGGLAGGRAETYQDPETGMFGTQYSRNDLQGPASVIGYATGIPSLGRAVGYGSEALGYGRTDLGVDMTNNGLQGAIDSGVTGFGYAGTDINSDINGDDSPTAYEALNQIAPQNSGLMSWPLLADTISGQGLY